MKTCKKCEVSKPLTAFNRRRVCRDCWLEYMREYYYSNKDRLLKYRREYNASEKGRAIHRQTKAKHRKKGNARALVKIAVDSGKLVKPTNCVNCGEAKPLQGHHTNYDEPLNVLWLCRKCHGEIHRSSSV